MSAARRRRPGVAPAALTLAGAAAAVLAGRDGSWAWQTARVAACVGITAAAVLTLSKATPGWRGRVGRAAGAVAVAVGLGFLPHLAKDGATPTALAATVLAAAGVVLLWVGAAELMRSRRLLRRIGIGIWTVLLTAVVAFVVGPAIAATNVPRPSIGARPTSFALDVDRVRLTTEDGVELAAWYVPSTNRSAVVLLHGAGSTRSNVLPQAAVLARHGYGVLVVDARGHGESGGRAMDFGWHGDADIEAATAFLAASDDVDPTRIGVVGMSMGGEEAIGATASNPRIRAVVAEGATARTAGDEAWLSDEFGLRGAFQEQLEKAQDLAIDLLSSARKPTTLRSAVARSGDTRFLIITAGKVADERRAGAHVAAAAPDRVEVWTVPGAGHTDGLSTAPAVWERRVTAFLRAALAPTGNLRRAAAAAT